MLVSVRVCARRDCHECDAVSNAKLPRFAYEHVLKVHMKLTFSATKSSHSLSILKHRFQTRAQHRSFPFVSIRSYRALSFVTSCVFVRHIVRYRSSLHHTDFLMDRSCSQSPRRPGRGEASGRRTGGFGGGDYSDWSTSFDHEDGNVSFPFIFCVIAFWEGIITLITHTLSGIGASLGTRTHRT